MKLKFIFKKRDLMEATRFKDVGLRGRAEGNQAAGGDPQHLSQFARPQEHRPIYALVAKVNPKIGYTTVYRTLKLLTRLGLATQRKFADGETRYERTSEGSHHDHLICLDCGKIIEFEDQTLETLQNRIARRHHFKPFHHRMELYGLCSGCYSKKGDKGEKQKE